MIIQALCDYYERKAADPDSGIAPPGLESKEIKFVIEIDEEGNFLNLKDTREGEKGHVYLVPASCGRPGKFGWKKAFLLWDHYGYTLGHPKKGDSSQKALEMAQRQNRSFIERIRFLPDNIRDDEGVKSVLAFYEKGELSKVKEHPNWESCSRIAGCNLSFQLSGDTCLVSERPVVCKYVQTLSFQDSDEPEMRCLVTGKLLKVKRIHSKVYVSGAKSNAKFVGCQKNSGYDSYHKEQAFNSPMCQEVENAYTTALNHLTRSVDSKVYIGDTTTVFWSQRKTDLESGFPWVFADPPKDDPDRGVRAVKALFDSIHSGKLSSDRENRFYVLGMAPNAARVSVRYWKTGKIYEFSQRIFQHFEDLAIVKGPKDPEYLALNPLLRSTVLDYKIDNVPPNLAGQVVSSILDGTPYPETLVQQCLRRIRAERNVTYKRAAILKACLNRKNRFYKTGQKEVAMALDRTNLNPGYLLGRLFAVLEKVQEEGNPGINATIRDRFYGAASSTPVTVFSQLLKLKNHHLAKMQNYGRKVFFEKEIGQIMDGISEFPAHLQFSEQARFAIGYYHQRQHFFQKVENNTEISNERG